MGAMGGLPALVELPARDPRRGPARAGEPPMAAGVAVKGGSGITRWRAIFELVEMA